jgi:hypothetical protein
MVKEKWIIVRVKTYRLRSYWLTSLIMKSRIGSVFSF